MTALLVACGGGGGGGPTPSIGNPLPPAPTNAPLAYACKSASGSVPTSGIYGCVRMLAPANPNSLTAPNGWVYPVGSVQATQDVGLPTTGLATQDAGLPTIPLHVYVGGVYHDPLHQPTGSIALTTDSAGFFATNAANLMAALQQSTAYYGATDKNGTPYALIEVTQYALAPPCTAPVTNIGAPAQGAPPNGYPLVPCGVAMPTPMPSAVPGGLTTATQLFPYSDSATTAQFVRGLIPRDARGHHRIALWNALLRDQYLLRRVGNDDADLPLNADER